MNGKVKEVLGVCIDGKVISVLSLLKPYSRPLYLGLASWDTILLAFLWHGSFENIWKHTFGELMILVEE